MVDQSDPLLLPTWLQVVLAAVVAVVTAAVGALTTGILIATGITKKFSETEKSMVQHINDLRLHVDASDSKRFHDLIGIIQQESLKTEGAAMELGRRIGATEQDLAVMRDFKARVERRE